MEAARRLLILGAIVFGGVGLGCLLAPVELMRFVDVELPTASARVEIYAFYGGLELGVAFFLGLTAARTDWIPLGLTALACMSGGLGVARFLGALLVDGPAWVHVPIAVLELCGAALCVWALRRVRDARSPLWF